ncbi:hypothetical protein HDU97_005202 [Phlyctochytrium planicorne]|nr:hypothetical protein HDU97_005202 [Phlyctochytrium planicorne]
MFKLFFSTAVALVCLSSVQAQAPQRVNSTMDPQNFIEHGCSILKNACKTIPTPQGYTSKMTDCTNSYYAGDEFMTVYGYCQTCPTGVSTFQEGCSMTTIKKASGDTYYKFFASESDSNAIAKAMEGGCDIENSSKCPKKDTAVFFMGFGEILGKNTAGEYTFSYIVASCYCGSPSSAADGVIPMQPSVSVNVPGFVRARDVDAGLNITPLTNPVAGPAKTVTPTVMPTVSTTTPTGKAPSSARKLQLAFVKIPHEMILFGLILIVSFIGLAGFASAQLLPFSQQPHYCDLAAEACSLIPPIAGFIIKSSFCFSTNLPSDTYPFLSAYCKACPSDPFADAASCKRISVKGTDGISFYKLNATIAEYEALKTALAQRCSSSAKCENGAQMASGLETQVFDPATETYRSIAGTCECRAIDDSGITAPKNPPFNLDLPGFSVVESIDVGSSIHVDNKVTSKQHHPDDKFQNGKTKWLETHGKIGFLVKISFGWCSKNLTMINRRDAVQSPLSFCDEVFVRACAAAGSAQNKSPKVPFCSTSYPSNSLPAIIGVCALCQDPSIAPIACNLYGIDGMDGSMIIKRNATEEDFLVQEKAQCPLCSSGTPGQLFSVALGRGNPNSILIASCYCEGSRGTEDPQQNFTLPSFMPIDILKVDFVIPALPGVPPPSTSVVPIVTPAPVATSTSTPSSKPNGNQRTVSTASVWVAANTPQIDFCSKIFDPLCKSLVNSTAQFQGYNTFMTCASQFSDTSLYPTIFGVCFLCKPPIDIYVNVSLTSQCTARAIDGLDGQIFIKFNATKEDEQSVDAANANSCKNCPDGRRPDPLRYMVPITNATTAPGTPAYWSVVTTCLCEGGAKGNLKPINPPYFVPGFQAVEVVKVDFTLPMLAGAITTTSASASATSTAVTTTLAKPSSAERVEMRFLFLAAIAAMTLFA